MYIIYLLKILYHILNQIASIILIYFLFFPAANCFVYYTKWYISQAEHDIV